MEAMRHFNNMNSFEKNTELIAATEADSNAFYVKVNRATGTRLRKAFLEIKTAAGAGRNEVSELKNKDSK